jgi:hypothetical protein
MANHIFQLNVYTMVTVVSYKMNKNKQYNGRKEENKTLHRKLKIKEYEPH